MYASVDMTGGEDLTQVAPSTVPEKRKSRKKLIIVVAVIVAAIAIIGVAAALGNSSHPPPLTIVSSGTVLQLGGSQYKSQEFTLNTGATLTGSFTVSGGSATLYLFTPSEYAAFTSGSTSLSYVYTSGSVTSGGVNTNIPSGSYYLVFASGNLLFSESIDITGSFVASSS